MERAWVWRGFTMTEISRHLPRRPLKGVTVVQMNGAGNAHHSGIPYLGSLLGQLVNAYDAQTIHFPVPAFFDYADTKTAMWRERSVQKNLHASRMLTSLFLAWVLLVDLFLLTCIRVAILRCRSSVSCVSWALWGICARFFCVRTAPGLIWS